MNYEICGNTIGEMWMNLNTAILEAKERSFDEGRERMALQSIMVFSETQQIHDKIIEKYGNSEFVESIISLTFDKDTMHDFDIVPSFSPGADSYAKRIKDGKMLDFVVKRLTKFPESKKACISFPNYNDYRAVLENPNDDYLPCIVAVQFRLLPPDYKTMNTMFYARSADAFQKLAGNFVAMAIMSYKVATELSENLNREIKVGSLKGLIADAHIYKECYKDAKKMVEKYETNKH